jgi:hypothetical protein
MTSPRTHESGAALLMSLLVTVMLFGIAGAYMTMSYASFENGNREKATADARFSAESGIQLSIAELKKGVDADGDGLGNVTTTAADGRIIRATVTNLGGNLYRIHSTAVLGRARKGADAIVELIPSGTLSANVGGAITSKGPVQTQGSITIDGRDWNAAGSSVVGPGGYGIQCAQSITTTGNAMVGGNGIVPAKPPPPGTMQANSTFTDGIDNDGDGVQNEEAFEGVDNDGDGKVDEDTQGFPTSPDVLLHLAPGTLKAAAISTNTYFTDSLQLTACMVLNGGKMPGGKVIYCDFTTWLPADVGNGFNTQPSILIHHNSTGTAMMKNVHGYFKGLMIVDGLDHFNGTFSLLGACVSFSSSAVGNAFGLGNATIRYSSEVLTNLPSIGGLTKARIKSWSRSGSL